MLTRIVETMDKKYDVFISYSSKDKQIAYAICSKLEQKGIACWVAPRDVRPGERYAIEIINGIKCCRLMILVYTCNSNESQHVANEIDRAFNEGKTIIPFFVEDVSMADEFSYYLARNQWFIAYPNYAEKLDQLAQVTASNLGIELKNSDESEVKKQTIVASRRRENVAKSQAVEPKVKKTQVSRPTSVAPKPKLKVETESVRVGEETETSGSSGRIMKKWKWLVAVAVVATGIFLLKFSPKESSGELKTLTSVDSIRISAEQGDAMAQMEYGIVCRDLYSDDKNAVKWFRKSAEQGNARGLCSLGEMLYQGRGISQNNASAAECFLKAAEQGHAVAQYHIGAMYFYGEGVDQNVIEAARWFGKSAEQGVAEAQYNFGVMYYKGVGVALNNTEAMKWFRKAAEQGYPEAQCALGEMYEKGLGVAKDKDEAIRLYRLAAAQECQEAKDALNRFAQD